MTWQQLDDKDGKYITCTITPSGQVTDASALFAKVRGKHK
jgi:hypothetical protein